MDIYETEDPLHYAVASSTAAMVSRGNIWSLDSEMVLLMEEDGGEGPYCRLLELQRERNQGRIAECTGFLVGEDLLLTSNHCLEPADGGGTCSSHAWVFGYAVSDPRQLGNPFLASLDDVYTCRAIVKRSAAKGFALVRLDRRVEGRVPLTLRALGRVDDGARLFTVGYPGGLPLKITVGGRVDINEETAAHFSVVLDIFRGNSGGPVVDAVTGVVEGIVRDAGTVGAGLALDPVRECLSFGGAEVYAGVDRVMAVDIGGEAGVISGSWRWFSGLFSRFF